jgi:hypothetical protein
VEQSKRSDEIIEALRLQAEKITSNQDRDWFYVKSGKDIHGLGPKTFPIRSHARPDIPFIIVFSSREIAQRVALYMNRRPYEFSPVDDHVDLTRNIGAAIENGKLSLSDYS